MRIKSALLSAKKKFGKICDLTNVRITDNNTFKQNGSQCLPQATCTSVRQQFVHGKLHKSSVFFWKRNESERTTPKMDFKLYTLYMLYTIFTQLKNTVTEGNFMKKATRGIVQDGGHPHVNWNKLWKPTSAHTNRPKLYRKIEQCLPFHKRQKSPSKSGFFVKVKLLTNEIVGN